MFFGEVLSIPAAQKGSQHGSPGCQVPSEDQDICYVLLGLQVAIQISVRASMEKKAQLMRVRPRQSWALICTQSHLAPGVCMHGAFTWLACQKAKDKGGRPGRVLVGRTIGAHLEHGRNEAGCSQIQNQLAQKQGRPLTTFSLPCLCGMLSDETQRFVAKLLFILASHKEDTVD